MSERLRYIPRSDQSSLGHVRRTCWRVAAGSDPQHWGPYPPYPILTTQRLEPWLTSKRISCAFTTHHRAGLDSIYLCMVIAMGIEPTLLPACDYTELRPKSARPSVLPMMCGDWLSQSGYARCYTIDRTAYDVATSTASHTTQPPRIMQASKKGT